MTHMHNHHASLQVDLTVRFAWPMLAWYDLSMGRQAQLLSGVSSTYSALHLAPLLGSFAGLDPVSGVREVNVLV